MTDLTTVDTNFREEITGKNEEKEEHKLQKRSRNNFSDEKNEEGPDQEQRKKKKQFDSLSFNDKDHDEKGLLTEDRKANIQDQYSNEQNNKLNIDNQSIFTSNNKEMTDYLNLSLNKFSSTTEILNNSYTAQISQESTFFGKQSSQALTGVNQFSNVDESGQFQGLSSSSQSTSILGTNNSNSHASSLTNSPILIRIPNNRVGLLIGTRGEMIRTLQNSTGAQIQLTPEEEISPSGEVLRVFHLKGTPEAIAAAKEKIDSIINFRTPITTHLGSSGDQTFQTTITVPNDKVGLIIGKNGQTVKSIHARTSATIFIPPDPDHDCPMNRTLQITGSKQHIVDSARDEILSLVDMGSNFSPNIFVVIPNEKIGLLIGKSGSTIKNIQTRYHCKIMIPPEPDIGSNPATRTCGILGTVDGATKAKYEIEALIGGNQQFILPEYYPPQQQQQQPFNIVGSMPDYRQQYSQYQQQTLAIQSPFDPSSYFEQFWQYAAYYGEEAARRDYGTYAPPVGTLPPPHLQPYVAGHYQQNNLSNTNTTNLFPR